MIEEVGLDHYNYIVFKYAPVLLKELIFSIVQYKCPGIVCKINKHGIVRLDVSISMLVHVCLPVKISFVVKFYVY